LQTFKPRVERHEITLPKSPLLRTKLRSHTVCAGSDAVKWQWDACNHPCNWYAGACQLLQPAVALLAPHCHVLCWLCCSCLQPKSEERSMQAQPRPLSAGSNGSGG
jgi:hypothetical protein